MQGPIAEEIKRTRDLRLIPSRGQWVPAVCMLDQTNQKSPWHDVRVRLAASHAIDRTAIAEADSLGASPPMGSLIPPAIEFALAIEPPRHDGAGRVPHGLAGEEAFAWISIGHHLLARLAPETGSLRLKTSCCCCLLNPVHVAENVATLDHITHGRLDLGVAIGYREKELEAAGLTRKDRVPKLEERALCVA
jgi:hypothetical protein